MASTIDRLALRLGALFGFFGVIFGTMAAHGPLHDYLERAGHLDYWRTALLYQWFHALALLTVGPTGSAQRGTVILWLIGVILFSGSLYVLALDSNQKWAGPVTPVGGLMLLAGWARLWLGLLKKPSS